MSNFELDKIKLILDTRTNIITASYGDLSEDYSLSEFVNDHDAPLGKISMVSLMMSARVKFASSEIV
jgi:hypothetical protein